MEAMIKFEGEQERESSAKGYNTVQIFFKDTLILIMYTFVHMSAVPTELRGVEFFGVTGDCELSNAGAKTQTGVFCKSGTPNC